MWLWLVRVRTIHAIRPIVIALHVLSRRHVAHLLHRVPFHPQRGRLERSFLCPRHVHGFGELPGLVRQFVDGLVADLAGGGLDVGHGEDGRDVHLSWVHREVRQLVGGFVCHRTVAGEEVVTGEDQIRLVDGLRHVIVLLCGYVLHGTIPDQFVVAWDDRARRKSLRPLIRQLVYGPIRYLPFPYTQVVRRYDHRGFLPVRRQVRLPVDRVVLHLQLRGHVVPLRRVGFRPRWLDVPAFLPLHRGRGDNGGGGDGRHADTAALGVDGGLGHSVQDDGEVLGRRG